LPHEVVEAAFEKNLWLLRFRATRKLLSTAQFNGVTLEHIGVNLSVFVEDPRNADQLAAANQLTKSLRETAAGLTLGDSLSLPGTSAVALNEDLELRRLEKDESTLVFRPKVSAAGATVEVRLVYVTVSGAAGMKRVDDHHLHGAVAAADDDAPPGQPAHARRLASVARSRPGHHRSSEPLRPSGSHLFARPLLGPGSTPKRPPSTAPPPVDPHPPGQHPGGGGTSRHGQRRCDRPPVGGA